MDPIKIFFIVAGILTVISIVALLKVRTMPTYKVVEESDSKGVNRFFAKIRKGFNYCYLVQTHDAPGYENDIFDKISSQSGGQETEKLAKMIISNHKMTVITGTDD